MRFFTTIELYSGDAVGNQRDLEAEVAILKRKQLWLGKYERLLKAMSALELQTCSTSKYIQNEDIKVYFSWCVCEIVGSISLSLYTVMLSHFKFKISNLTSTTSVIACAQYFFVKDRCRKK